MSDEQQQEIGSTLQEILAELRKINEREEQRERKASAVVDRFANL
jgi:hypothetical protein